MKILDCFLFFNEFEIFEARIRYLSEAVDLFLVVESSTTFSGIKKRFTLREYILSHSYLASLKDRIIIFENERYLSEKNDFNMQEVCELNTVGLEELKRTYNSCTENRVVWLNDCFQRELLSVLLEKHASSKDKIIISDIDEIPSLNFVEQIINENTLYFSMMKEYYYSICFYSKEDWTGSVMTSYDLILANGINVVRFYTKRNYNKLNIQYFSKGGWHFTSMGERANILNKIISWGHQELNTPINRRLIGFRIKRGFDIFGRKSQLVYEEENNLPDAFEAIVMAFKGGGFIKPNVFSRMINDVARMVDITLRKLRTFKKVSDDEKSE